MADSEKLTFKQSNTGLPTFPKLAVGDRVYVKQTGVTGVIVKRGHPHNGWKVRWDEPKFGVTEGWARTVHLEKIEERFVVRKDGRGWRVRDTVRGHDHSHRIADKERAQRQADALNANMVRIREGFSRTQETRPSGVER